MIERERSINVEKFDNDQLDLLQKQLSVKLTHILENASTEANRLLNIYGMEVQIAYKLKKAKKSKKAKK